MDVGEDLLAETGLSAYLNDAPVRFGVEMQKRALATRSKMRRALRAFLTGGQDFERARAMEPFRWQRALEQLSNPPDQRKLAAKLHGQDPGVATPWVEAAGRAVTYLTGALRRRERVTPTGPQVLPPSDMEIARFRHAWEMAEDPMVLLEALAEGSLSIRMAQTFGALWPDLYAELQQALPELLVTIKGQRPSFELPWPREKQARALMGASWGPMLEDMQASFGREKQAQQNMQPQGQASAPNIAGNVQTSVDRVASK